MAFALPALPALGSLFGGAATAGAVTTTAELGGALGTVIATTPAIPAAASTLPAWLGYTSAGLTALGGATGAYGAIQSANAQANADKYNAQVAQINQSQAQTNARIAGQAGAEQAAMTERRTRAEVGQEIANEAASGIDVNKGSALDVRASSSELGELDALTVRSNAAREAYGYQTQATSFQNQGQLDTFAAKNAEKAGGINAAGTFLGAASAGTSNYLRYLQAGGFTG